MRWSAAEAQRAAKARKDSKEELFRVIEKWGEATNLERFFLEAESRATSLPDGEGRAALKRIQLAGGIVGKRDPLEYVLSWRTPEERLGVESGDDDDEDEDADVDWSWQCPGQFSMPVGSAEGRPNRPKPVTIWKMG